MFLLHVCFLPQKKGSHKQRRTKAFVDRLRTRRYKQRARLMELTLWMNEKHKTVTTNSCYRGKNQAPF